MAAIAFWLLLYFWVLKSRPLATPHTGSIVNPGHDKRDEVAGQIQKALVQLEGIASLPGLLDDAIPFFERRRDYCAFWQRAKEVSALFKGSSLRRDVRERLWIKHSALCERVKNLQNREREERYYESKRNRDQIPLHPSRGA